MNVFGRNFRRGALAAAVLLAAAAFALAQPAARRIALELDATDAPRSLFRVRQTISVAPDGGRLALFYPKWIPGEHAPTGPLNDLVGLYVTADGRPLAWRRDDVEMYAFEVDVPAGARAVEVAFDYAAPPFTIASANLARLKWNRFVLYPRGAAADEVEVAAAVRLPAGWQLASALPVARETAARVEFAPVSLTTFVDSPAIIGRYFAKIPLGGDVPTEMALAADSPAALEARPATRQGWKNLVEQGNLMFGARHYGRYVFLTTLSDYGGDEGLEHHESSENGVGEKALSDEPQLLDLGELLGHEYAHSWNGKYRRPAGLATRDFEEPMRGELLWVYEGLTQYLGKVLAARSGLWTAEMFRESLAATAAEMDFRAGRQWRPLVDTARAVQFTYPGSREWLNARRGVDYYSEGALVWLEADVLIREKSGGRRSLDDFLRRFHGGANSGAVVKTYDLAELVRELDAVLPFDWNAFFAERVYRIQPRAPLGGLANGGWRLVYDETPNRQETIDATRTNLKNLMYSVGLSVNADGVVFDVQPERPAARAGLAPGMTIKTVEGAEFDLRAFENLIAATRGRETKIVVEAVLGETGRTFEIVCRDGLKSPHLVRDPAKTDHLSAIAKPLNRSNR